MIFFIKKGIFPIFRPSVAGVQIFKITFFLFFFFIAGLRAYSNIVYRRSEKKRAGEAPKYINIYIHIRVLLLPLFSDRLEMMFKYAPRPVIKKKSDFENLYPCHARPENNMRFSMGQKAKLVRFAPQPKVATV